MLFLKTPFLVPGVDHLSNLKYFFLDLNVPHFKNGFGMEVDLIKNIKLFGFSLFTDPMRRYSHSKIRKMVEPRMNNGKKLGTERKKGHMRKAISKKAQFEVLLFTLNYIRETCRT